MKSGFHRAFLISVFAILIFFPQAWAASSDCASMSGRELLNHLTGSRSPEIRVKFESRRVTDQIRRLERHDPDLAAIRYEDSGYYSEAERMYRYLGDAPSAARMRSLQNEARSEYHAALIHAKMRTEAKGKQLSTRKITEILNLAESHLRAEGVAYRRIVSSFSRGNPILEILGDVNSAHPLNHFAAARQRRMNRLIGIESDETFHTVYDPFLLYDERFQGAYLHTERTLFLPHDAILKLRHSDVTLDHELKHIQEHLRSMRTRLEQPTRARPRPLEGHIKVDTKQKLHTYQKDLFFDEVNAQRRSIRKLAHQMRSSLSSALSHAGKLDRVDLVNLRDLMARFEISHESGQLRARQIREALEEWKRLVAESGGSPAGLEGETLQVPGGRQLRFDFHPAGDAWVDGSALLALPSGETLTYWTRLHRSRGISDPANFDHLLEQIQVTHEMLERTSANLPKIREAIQHLPESTDKQRLLDEIIRLTEEAPFLGTANSP